MNTRPATRDDRPSIARIYNHGIDERIATFETRHRGADEIAGWLGGRFPIVVVEDEGQVIGFAATFAYSARECYAGIAEFSVYVAPEARRRGAARLALNALIEAAEEAGFWKLLSRIFIENVPSRNLVTSVGFRELGIYEKHGQLDGVWRDVVIVERLIEANLGD